MGKLVSYTLEEKAFLYDLVEKITGTHQQGHFKKDIIETNVFNRIKVSGNDSLNSYLNYANAVDKEFKFFLNAITIHHTDWFRESIHLENLEHDVRRKLESNPTQMLSFCSLACSTGEEVYSIALILESIRQTYPGFDYEISASDIDPISVGKARKAIYELKNLKKIPKEYHQFIKIGKNKAEGYFTFEREIRNRISIEPLNLSSEIGKIKKQFDYIFCRNVLIYFKRDDVESIIKNISSKLKPNGVLTLALSEALVNPKDLHLEYQWASSYRISFDEVKTLRKKESKSALIIDDSKIMVKVLSKILSDGGFETTGANSAFEASNILRKKSFDFISLDLNMPGESGQDWLKKQRLNGLQTPVVIVTEANPLEAVEVVGSMNQGAQDYILKSDLKGNKKSIIDLADALTKKDKSLVTSNNTQQDLRPPEVILIGASTGGTKALSVLLKSLQKPFPPVCIVQHIDSMFAGAFNLRLAEVSGLKLGKVKDGNKIEENHIYLADKQHHFYLQSREKEIVIKTKSMVESDLHCPSVDHLFSSDVKLASSTAAFILTGMGKDGSVNLKRLSDNGAMTFAQDQESSVVFGMPRAAIELGAAGFVGNLKQLREQLDTLADLYSKSG